MKRGTSKAPFGFTRNRRKPIRRYRARRFHAGLVHGSSWGNGVELVENKKKRSAAQDHSATQSKGHDAGSALRTVYQRTVDEDVPDEMLDLLSKLK